MSPILESRGEDDHGFATGEPEDEQFPIYSDDAYVAIASVACRSCFHRFDAICIFCRSGTAFEEELDNFTVANVHGVDESLAQQLALWPTYRWLGSTDDPGDLANHCPSCGEPYDDEVLHDEPEDPFFDIPNAGSAVIRVVRVKGTIQLSGDEHYTIED